MYKDKLFSLVIFYVLHPENGRDTSREHYANEAVVE